MPDVPKNIRVVIVDDSPTVCRLLAESLQSVPDIQVVAIAHDGNRAVEIIREMRPDVVTLDIDMPGLSGLETLKVIMQVCPTPVIMISGVSGRSADATLEALGAGAIDFVLKYLPGTSLSPETLHQEVVGKIRMSAGIQVIRTVRTGGLTGLWMEQAATARPPSERCVGARCAPFDIVVIGASTGGPVAVRKALEPLPSDFPAAILIVQHLPATFTSIFAEQLNRSVAVNVREAFEGDVLTPGTALVAPGGFHLEVTANRRIRRTLDPEVEGHRPAADFTMKSAAKIFGMRAFGVVLTGMGRDGSQGLRAIREAGGRTLAQDGQSCVVNGMPQSAINLGVVDFVAPPTLIARRLIQLCCQNDKETGGF